ncbi:ferritin-like fold-containing protein [Gordonia zhaorongruii]|uniref:ferritin-like fold-containing protein n=1 Tax=Gordonia zhaorongruii TaxID=2597659 RepID=UPI0010515083|nr:ferritin-like fold-containing protein [Gordonia zhaorongruii]
MSNSSRALNKLYEVLLAGEFAACYRLIDESAMAQSAPDRIAIARLIAAELAHFEELAAELEKAGGDAETAITAHAAVFDEYHRVTMPQTWCEALVKMHIGDGLAADFHAELVEQLPVESQPVIASVMESTGSSEFAVQRVRAAIADDPALRSSLALWGRRLLGEAISHMQWVLAEDDEVMDLLFTGDGGLASASTFFDRMAERHGQRMADLGLS